jgi:hypothetical protein
VDIRSGFDIEVEIKNRHDSFKFTIEDARICQLHCGNKAISHQTLAKHMPWISSNLSVEGQSLNRITDSRLKLQTIDSVSVRLVPKNKGAWSMCFAQIECIRPKESNQITASEQPLFENSQISNYHFRQCLLDPKFFSVANKQIVSVISDSKVP